MAQGANIAPSEMHWRVFYTTARAEKKCAERLREREIEVFLPTYVTLRQWADRKKKVVEPLFRNYLFARVDERERLRVLQTDGIVRCVAFDGQPAIVVPDTIEQLQIAQRSPEGLTPISYPRPDIGEHVIIVDGPMRGLRGEVMRHQGQMYVVVRILEIQQALRVSVQADRLQRLGADATLASI